ncbi:hypothetical protein [Massilia putida]|uniref:hypothetical protein n=1 Tax=Massilia putida TaxID=1141883 RepID=UPI001C54F83F|nr:hypothetical protein [Massilia putida]
MALSNKQHNQMDGMIGRLYDAIRAGEVSRERAIGGLAHVMAALDIGNTGEAVAWFNQPGVEFFNDALDSKEE